MAIIGKIREKGGLVVFVIGLSMLLFIAGEVLTSSKGLFGNKNELGVIAGTSISPQEFQARVDEFIANYKINTNTETVDANTTDQLREEAWTSLVKEIVFGKEYKLLGITVSEEEISDMIMGKDPHPQIKQAFTDQKTGVYNPQNVVNFLKDLENRDQNTRNRWDAFHKAIIKERYESKLKNLAKFGIYVTSAEVKRAYTDQGRQAKINYVLTEYKTIPDSTVKVTDAEINEYYNAHKHEYKQEQGRKIEYVVYDVKPSDEDKKIVEDWATKLMEDFKTAPVDSDFVNRNSDTKFADIGYKKGKLNPELDSIMFAAKEGFVYGPYSEGNMVKVAKLSKITQLPDSVKARHILIKTKEGVNPADSRAKLDSLKKLIKGGANFADLAKTNSEDGSASAGGDLGWFKEGAMVKPFQDACFNGKVGDLPIVESQFGIHLIEIQNIGTTSKQVKLAIVERKIEPTTKTFNAVLAKANEFATMAKTGPLFDSASVKLNVIKRVADNLKETDKNVAGLESPRELVLWAYKSKKDEISKVYSFGDKYVIAHLMEIREKGIAPLDQVKTQIEIAAKKEKKGQTLIDQMTKSSAGATSIEDIAAKVGTPMDSTDFITFQGGKIPGRAAEPEVIGKIFNMKAGEISKPIKGTLGVYIVQIVQFTEPAATTDYSTTKNQLLATFQQKADNGILEALKELAKIVDNRGKYF